MKWEKLGQIYHPDGSSPKMLSHAANPVAEWREGSIFRIYFSARDAGQRAHIGTVDIDIYNPQTILEVAEIPVVEPGPPGTFDDSGTSMGWLLQHEGKRYLYYLGWNLGVTVPWRNSIGLAISQGPGQPFEKVSPAPVLDRGFHDPYSLSYPGILVENGLWRMWYGSNLNWGAAQDEMAHLIKYAESRDGINWTRNGYISLNFQSPDEYAMSKPCVLRDGDRYRMWYSYRGKSYRIGYAESRNGLDWQRRDEDVGIGVSKSGWDSETIEYPHVFDHNGTKYMLYNGNEYGKSGFGLAVMTNDD